MDIHDKSGDLDLEAARHEAAGLAGARDERAGRVRAHELTIVALLDIAKSLRVLAIESAEAMGGVLRGEVVPFDLSEQEAPGISGFVVGDVVHLDGDTEPGEIAALGESEGELYADVLFAEHGRRRVFQRHLVLLRGDDAPHVSTPEEDAAMIDADDEPELFADPSDNEPDAAMIATELGEEIDDDFDGDDFDGDDFSAAEDAVAKLAAAEAERKAAKKSGPKKGKKA